MPEHWRFPVLDPLFTDSLAREIVEKAKGEERKAKAADTRLRFSDAGRCARAIAYDVIGIPPAAWDPASLHVAFVGTVYHELLQAALQRRYPGAEIEVKGVLPHLSNSGHADALVSEETILRVVVTWQGGRTLFELKTKGTFQFDAAVGVMRKQWQRVTPQGPGHEVILQAGLNALANDCETLVIGYVCFENFSVRLAERASLRQMDRFLAEWHIPSDVWIPLVKTESQRLQMILDTVDGGHLPERLAYDDEGEIIVLDPEAQKPRWHCDYCSFRTQCEQDGAGVTEAPAT